jgi:hypothetical protein
MVFGIFPTGGAFNRVLPFRADFRIDTAGSTTDRSQCLRPYRCRKAPSKPMNVLMTLVGGKIVYQRGDFMPHVTTSR